MIVSLVIEANLQEAMHSGRDFPPEPKFVTFQKAFQYNQNVA